MTLITAAEHLVSSVILSHLGDTLPASYIRCATDPTSVAESGAQRYPQAVISAAPRAIADDGETSSQQVTIVVASLCAEDSSLTGLNRIAEAVERAIYSLSNPTPAISVMAAEAYSQADDIVYGGATADGGAGLQTDDVLQTIEYAVTLHYSITTGV